MGSSRFVRKVAIGLLASGTVIGLTAAAGAASAAPQARHPLDGSMPKWLHQAHDMGASSPTQRMNFGVLLASGLRRRDRSGHATRSGVLSQRPALTALIAREPGRFSSPARAAFTGSPRRRPP